jgi:hypothetical protein
MRRMVERGYFSFDAPSPAAPSPAVKRG